MLFHNAARLSPRAPNCRAHRTAARFFTARTEQGAAFTARIELPRVFSPRAPISGVSGNCGGERPWAADA